MYRQKGAQMERMKNQIMSSMVNEMRHTAPENRGKVAEEYSKILSEHMIDMSQELSPETEEEGEE
jgi:hypothetical protein